VTAEAPFALHDLDGPQLDPAGPTR
jgi:hypothetical protein